MIAFLYVLFLTSTNVQAQGKVYPDAYIREQVQQIIMERHPSDSRTWWRALGPTAPRVIIQMYGESERVEHKMRLVNGLSWFDTEEVRDFLVEQAKATDETGIRVESVRALGHSQGSQGLDDLASFLKHDDPNTRVAAARAVQKIAQNQDARAQKILQQYLAQEPKKWIRMSLTGEKPQVRPGQVRWVSNSHERFAPELSGTWQGYWLEPLDDPKNKKQAMRSWDAKVELQVPEQGVPSAKIVLTLLKKRKEFELQSVSADPQDPGRRIRGQIRLKGSQDSKDSKANFEALLSFRSGRHSLRFEVPEWSSHLIVSPLPQ